MRSTVITSAILAASLGCAPVDAKSPVNSNSVRVVPPPPAGYDPVTASPAVNAQFALPPEPDEMKTPRTHEMWKHAVRAARDNEPIRIEHTAIRHGPAIGKMRIAAATDENGPLSSNSNNWSGTSIVNGTTSNVEAITALFIVPTAHQAFGQCGDGWDYSALWPGIDGNGGVDVLQAGVEVNAFCAGNNVTQAQYYPWVEWYPNSEARVSSPTINAGDLVFIEVWSTSPTQGYAYIYNYSTDVSAQYALSAPAGYQLSGQSVEWIVERPTIGSSLATLTNYIAVPWAEGVAWNYAAPNPTTYSMGGTPDVGTLEQITMMDDSNNPISTVTINGGNFLWFQSSGSACGINQQPC